MQVKTKAFNNQLRLKKLFKEITWVILSTAIEVKLKKNQSSSLRWKYYQRLWHECETKTKNVLNLLKTNIFLSSVS